MNRKNSFMVAVFAVALSAPAYAQNFRGSELAKGAPLSLAQARTIALRAVHGTIVDQELEREKGGLRYSFDIRAGGKTYEVGVDAKSGRVVETAVEGKNPD